MNDQEVQGPKCSQRSWPRRAAVGILCVLLFVALLPYLIAATPLRNILLQRAVSRANMQASTGAASFGWFAPLNLHGLQLKSPRGEPLVQIHSLGSDKPWWKILLSRPDLGTFHVDRPRIELVLTPDGSNFDGVGGKKGQDSSILTAKIRDGTFSVRTSGNDDPSINIGGVNLVAHIRRTKEGRALVVDPIQPLDRQQITPEMCRNGLQLIAPILADTARVQGQISLALNSLRVPIESPQDAEISGVVELHSVETGLNSRWLNSFVGLVGAILKTEVPSMVRIADESTIHFHVSGSRVYHDGLAFGLPEVDPNLVIRTSGSVGLDESLDLIVEVPRVGKRLLGELMDLEDVDVTPLRIKVAGTLNDPNLALADGGGPFQQILSNLLATQPDSQQPLAGTLLDLLGEQLQQRRESQEADREDRVPLLERLRLRREK